MSSLLFGVEGSGYIKMGLPPAAYSDSFSSGAKHIGYLKGFSHVLFSPDGTMFAIRGAEIYCGPPPSNPNEDWLSTNAKCVGRADWNGARLLFFHPDGTLYVITNDQQLYKGPSPDNMHVSWLYRVATKIGSRGWDFPRVFFDPQGMMYAVTKQGKLVKRMPPKHANDQWLKSSETIGSSGWAKLTHFMAFSDDGNLWCVSDVGGNIYSAPPPRNANVSWINGAQKLGYNYNRYKILAFTEDKTISKVLGMDFDVDNANILSVKPMIVGQQDYDNTKGIVPYDTTFQFSEKVTLESTFSHQHGFTFAVGASTTFKAGIPMIAQNETTVKLDISTTNTWNFVETERTEIVSVSSIKVTVPPGKALRFKALVQKGEMDVPYKAQVVTEFGHKTTVRGMWKGASVSRVEIEQHNITDEQVK